MESETKLIIFKFYEIVKLLQIEIVNMMAYKLRIEIDGSCVLWKLEKGGVLHTIEVYKLEE